MSQTDAILRALKSGRRITHMDALHEFGCFRLSARVLELRREGHRIERKMLHKGGKYYAEYRLL